MESRIKKIVIALLCLFMLTACSQRDYMKALKAIDSIVDSDAQTAGVLLESIDRSGMNGRASAYYAYSKARLTCDAGFRSHRTHWQWLP